MVSETATQQWVPAFRQPFSSSMPAMPAVPQSQFLSAVGSPPFRSRASAFAKDSDPVPSPTRSGDEAELIPSEEGFLEQVAREQILKWDRAQAKWTQWLGAAETRNSAHGDRQN